MQLKLVAESAQVASVLSSDDWWTATGMAMGGVASGSSAAADRQLYEPSSGRFEQRIVG